MDLNFESMKVINDCLGLDLEYQMTEVYKPEPYIDDFRYLVDAKNKKVYEMQPYSQVFQNKHGFLGNLSILDLLFNEGTNTLTYLEEHRSLLKSS